ncbi:Hypothetical protein PHPALM_6174 [Phytophthora palmivora]|uniref:DDE-1 domain-containing protein n=1 Tax=Phytophthora palmivora TaxID=4796 RepID=A0A2P4YFH9_9STRA|nr:Hypothetical protein PHPALM_6174 [Phytophthora palmivora]
MEKHLYREPVLQVIDSYGYHVKLTDSHRLERYNIYVMIIPRYLTNILQPLVVAVNCSFQAFYRNKYDEYIGSSATHSAGNPKIPSYNPVTELALDFMSTRTPDGIKRRSRCVARCQKERFNEDSCINHSRNSST